MIKNINFANEIELHEDPSCRYSICTLVSKPSEYAEMLDSFKHAGFNESFCEYLYINNSEKNKADAFLGINKFLQKARGKYIIICHQDILLKYDNIQKLEACIKEIDKLDPNWAIISNAGAVGIKNIVYRITESDKVLKKRGHTPRKVVSVDENFILVKKEANLALSSNLHGFHLYGTDLCIIADVLGFNAYVVNFNLLHKSKGNVDRNFFKLKKDLSEKYQLAFQGRHIQTTCTKFYLSGSRFWNFLLNTRFMMFWSRQYFKLKYRKDLSKKPL